MMSKKTRRILALVVIVALFSSLETLIKAMIVIPTIQILLIDFDEFNQINEEEGYEYE